MKSNLPLTLAQEEWLNNKIFSLMGRFGDLQLSSLSIQGDGNIFEVSVAGSHKARPVVASSCSFGFASAINQIRNKVIRQVSDIKTKEISSRLTKTKAWKREDDYVL